MFYWYFIDIIIYIKLFYLKFSLKNGLIFYYKNEDKYNINCIYSFDQLLKLLIINGINTSKKKIYLAWNFWVEKNLMGNFLFRHFKSFTSIRKIKIR